MADADYAHTFQSWNDAFNVCQNLYDDDKLEECINVTEEDLDDPTMPLYHRMRYMLLLVGCHEDWDKANDALVRCEAIFQSVSTYHKDDPDENVQDGLQDLRELIEGIRVDYDTQLREAEEADEVDEVDEEDEEVDDVDMMDEGAQEGAQEGGAQAGEEAGRRAGENATVKTEEMVEKRMPLSEIGEIEDMKLVHRGRAPV